jgi:hypothetical protein
MMYLCDLYHNDMYTEQENNMTGENFLRIRSAHVIKKGWGSKFMLISVIDVEIILIICSQI